MPEYVFKRKLERNVEYTEVEKIKQQFRRLKTCGYRTEAIRRRKAGYYIFVRRQETGFKIVFFTSSVLMRINMIPLSASEAAELKK